MKDFRKQGAVAFILFVAGILAMLDRSPEAPQSASPARVGDLTGRVLTVADGDTMTLEVDGERVKIRLQGIDCPEREQPFGKEAGDFVRAKTNGREVEIRSLGKDQYDRVLGEAFVEGENLNLELIRQGLAWWYERHARNRTDYRDAQSEARREKRGIWSDPEPTPPWQFRSKGG